MTGAADGATDDSLRGLPGGLPGGAADGVIRGAPRSVPGGSRPTRTPARIDAALRHPGLDRLRSQIVTPQGIYGTLIVAALIGSASDDDYDRDVFTKTIATMLVFWVAHVFADAIAHYGSHSSEGLTMSRALRNGVHDSSGLLWAAVIPCILLLTGAFGLFDEYTAYYLSLTVPVLVLALLGWFAFADRGSVWWVRLLGGFVTALLGVAIILLKIIFH